MYDEPLTTTVAFEIERAPGLVWGVMDWDVIASPCSDNFHKKIVGNVWKLIALFDFLNDAPAHDYTIITQWHRINRDDTWECEIVAHYPTSFRDRELAGGQHFWSAERGHYQRSVMSDTPTDD